MPRDLPAEWIPDIPAVRSARQIASAAEAAARAWAQALSAAELPLITACLDMSLLELSAAQVISCISRDLRDIADGQPRTGHDQPGTAAVTAARDLAAATYTAFTEIRQPAGSPAARDAAVSAFMHATGIIDTAIGNLADQAPGPLAAILTRQRIRLEHACRSLREALVASAVSQDDQPTLAAAARSARCTRSCRSAPRPAPVLLITRPSRRPLSCPGPAFSRRARDEPLPPAPADGHDARASPRRGQQHRSGCHQPGRHRGRQVTRRAPRPPAHQHEHRQVPQGKEKK